MFVEFSKSSYTLSEGTFVVDPRYKVLSAIGRGAQGLICAARDTMAQVTPEVAVKKMPNAVDEIISCKRMLREVRMMRHFQHENLLMLRDVMFPPSSNVLMWKDIYLVTDLMDTDLHQVISSKQELTDDHVQYFLYQLIAGVTHLHAANVVHRDLKPSNVLVNRNCDLKICDFGLSRACSGPLARLDEDNSEPLTMYVTTRWYRAPELLCFNSGYGMPVDMWSVACILGEMLGRVALFPGRDYLDQLRLVIELLGPPTEEEVQTIESPSAVSFVRKVNPQASKTLEELLPAASPASLALLRNMLRFDPAKRLQAHEALQDPYLAAYFNGVEEHKTLPAAHAEWLASIGSTDALPKEQLQNLIFQEMLYFHPDAIHVQWGAASHSAMAASAAPTDPSGGAGGGAGAPPRQAACSAPPGAPPPPGAQAAHPMSLPMSLPMSPLGMPPHGAPSANTPMQPMQMAQPMPGQLLPGGAGQPMPGQLMQGNAGQPMPGQPQRYQCGPGPVMHPGCAYYAQPQGQPMLSPMQAGPMQTGPPMPGQPMRSPPVQCGYVPTGVAPPGFGFPPPHVSPPLPCASPQHFMQQDPQQLPRQAGFGVPPGAYPQQVPGHAQPVRAAQPHASQ